MTRSRPDIPALDRMLLREIARGGGVLVAIALITAVGIMAFVSMLTTYRNLDQSRASYYARCRMADFWVDLKKAPLAEVELLRDVPGVADLHSRISFSVLVDLADVAKPLGGSVISMPETRQPVINDIVIRQGGYFTPHRLEEVIVSEDFAAARHLAPGDRLALIVNDRRVELLIVGTAIASEFVYLMPPGGMVPEPDQYGIFWVKRRFADEAFGFDGACNQVVGMLDPAVRSHPQVVLDEIERRLDAFGVYSTTALDRQLSNMSLAGEMQGLQTMAHFLPVLFLGVAAIVLNTLITSIADRQRTVIGTLKAVGYSNAAVFVHYIKFALVVALAGGLLGCAVGYWFADVLTEIYRSEFFKFPDLVNNVYPDVMLAGVLISAVFAVLGAVRGAYRLVRLHPAEAMRPAAPKAGHRVWLERFTGLWSRLGFIWQTVLRNVLRDRGRSLAGACASAVGAALMVVAFYQSDAMDFLVEFQFERILVSDFTLTLADDQDEGALLEARRLPGVHYAEGVFNVACTLRHGHRHHKVGIEGVKPGSVLTVPSDSSGVRVPIPASGLLVTPKLAGVLDIRAGDYVTLIPVRGVKDPHQVCVADVVDSYMGMGAYADYDWLNRLVGHRDAVSTVQLRTTPDAQERDALFRAVKQMPAVRGLRSASQTKQTIEEIMLGSMRAMTVIMIGFAGLIFFGSILNSAFISLSERQREVATYRVLGYRPSEVGAIFLRESLLVNLLGAGFGLLLGHWTSMAYAGSFDFETIRFPRVITLGSFVWAWLLALAFTLLAHLIVQRAINRLDWLEALNVKE